MGMSNSDESMSTRWTQISQRTQSRPPHFDADNGFDNDFDGADNGSDFDGPILITATTMMSGHRRGDEVATTSAATILKTTTSRAVPCPRSCRMMTRRSLVFLARSRYLGQASRLAIGLVACLVSAVPQSSLESAVQTFSLTSTKTLPSSTTIRTAALGHRTHTPCLRSGSLGYRKDTTEICCRH